MIKYLFDSFALKFFLITGGLLLLLIIVGNNIEDDPIRIEPWPSIDYEKEAVNKRTRNTKINRYYYREEPWNNERKEQTENWTDFLEELDNRGYTIYDPEAEDIWEEFY